MGKALSAVTTAMMGLVDGTCVVPGAAVHRRCRKRLRTLAPGNARRALAGMTAAFGLGQAIGPVAAGYGFDITGSFLLPSLIAAFGLCVAMTLALIVSRAVAG
jgi:cyanate permease